ncbi:MAG TPA: VacJ family lipoprotein, partial [Novosphingobium sp.]|nr:VacJ family lipoprotein [Novosphingobium sp.]
AAAEAEHETPTILVKVDHHHAAADPVQQANRASFAAVQAADHVVISPLAQAYRVALPTPARDGVHNMLTNLREPVVISNCLLQHHFGRAGRSLARLALNTTLGLGGLFDVARHKPFHLHHRANGFANTLGFYGMGAGPYFYLPIVGPTTLRDLAGTVADRVFLSATVGWPFTRLEYRVPSTVLGTLDERLANDPQIRQLRAEKADFYAARRNAYLAQRRAEIAALHRPETDIE